MTEPDQLLVLINRGVERRLAGDRPGARSLLSDLWDQIGPAGDALHRCALAHAMADAQDDVGEELRWDLRALDAAGELTEDRLAAAGVPGSVAGFFPSLHLNLADAYRRLGDDASAQEHVNHGRASLSALDTDGYAGQISAALDRVADQLDEGAG